MINKFQKIFSIKDNNVTKYLVTFVIYSTKSKKHMEKLLFFLILYSISTYGQQKVYDRNIFESKVLSAEKSEVNYPSLNRIKINEINSSFKNTDYEQRKINYDFTEFARKKNIRFHELNWDKSLFIEFYFNQKGEIDYVVQGFRNFKITGKEDKISNTIFRDTLSNEQKSVFVNIAEDFCKTYKLPLKNQLGNFSITTNIYFGKEQRKTRKNVISTIELAESCTKPDTVKTLILNKLYLETFPEVVFKFKNLEKLDLSDNYIEQVPSKVWQLKSLKFLSLSGNYIDYADFKFKRNKHLKDLNLQYTVMTKMPKSLRKNKNLEILFLGNNRINLAKNDFKKMTHLKALNLYNIRTSYLPKSISKLSNLEELDLYYNELKSLPKEICALKNLKTLALSNNELWNLPKEINQLTNLQMLYAHHNRLNSLPTLPNLKLLDIGYNLFKVFPEQVYEITNLEEFDITNNQVNDVPEKLLSLEKLQKVYFRGNGFMKENEKSKELSKLVSNLEERKVLVR